MSESSEEQHLSEEPKNSTEEKGEQQQNDPRITRRKMLERGGIALFGTALGFTILPRLQSMLTSKAPEVHYETGIHPTLESEYQKVETSLISGDLRPPVWNKEVGERLKPYKPTILAIDGQQPLPENRAKPDSNRDANDMLGVWASLPARPNELNDSGSVIVIQGDSSFHNLAYAVLPELDTLPDYAFQHGGTEFLKSTGYGVLQAAGEGGGAIAAGAAIYMLAADRITKVETPTESQNQNEQLDSNITTQKISRSEALKVGGLLLGGVALAGTAAGDEFVLSSLAAKAPDEATKDTIATVNDAMAQRILPQTWTDGRTALLLAKTQDAEKVMLDAGIADTKSAIVLGTAHNNGDALQTKDDRAQYIKAYAEILVNKGKNIYRQQYNTEEVPDEVINNILNYVSEFDFMQVDDPGGPDVQPDFLSRVQDYVSIPENLPYRNYSSEVLEAVKDLRPDSL